jgi:Arc/MetJ-type ribon-helix-helix transcriptional regulator
MGRQERNAPPDEKVTINLSPVDLGTIDLLVSEGLYSSRTDLIRDAIRKLIDQNRELIREVVVRRELNVGVIVYSKRDFERFKEKGERISLRSVGVLVLGGDITPDLADEVVESISVMGMLRAPQPVLDRLAGRITRGPRGMERAR